MLKIKIADKTITFAERGLMFNAVVDNDKLITLTDVREGDLKKPADKYVTDASAAGGAALRTFESAVMANDNVKNWEIDGLHVTVCRSAAGYYAGCIDTDGSPYNRISGYSANKAFVLHWMMQNAPHTIDKELNEQEENTMKTNMTIGQMTNLVTDVEKNASKIKILEARLEKAAVCWKQQRAINVALEGDNQRIAGELKRRDAVIADLNKAKAAADANVANALKEVKRLNGVNNVLKERLQKAAICWKQQRDEIRALKARIAELEAQLDNGSTTAA